MPDQPNNTPEQLYARTIDAIKAQRPNACKHLRYLLAAVEEGRKKITHDAKPADLQSNLEELEANLDRLITALKEERWLRGIWSSLFMWPESYAKMDLTRTRLYWYILSVREAQKGAKSRLPNN
ncbi:hypothetical protein [Ktedonospora formicarum]|uniref:Uncharacterized protein n=1 Tax=Ktedonospora formicarum TaxID=2778364 RepID=A0A8J3HWS0_9CHLR|nr:hypothetical protein [Ktedonospora formicarum]GHO42450.1 hypothetical protein KSX_06130 [Ktedonospora formicarum]